MVDDGTGPPVHCCGEEKDDDVILCGSGMNCLHGGLFHYSCVGLDLNNLPNNWFCGEACRDKKDTHHYCTCHKYLGNDEPMISCSAESNCCGDEWYHLRCIGITDDNVHEGNWFCKSACKRSKLMKGKKQSGKGRQKGQKQDDYNNKYSLAVALCGLNSKRCCTRSRW